jgi:hypothetical protein
MPVQQWLRSFGNRFHRAGAPSGTGRFRGKRRRPGRRRMFLEAMEHRRLLTVTAFDSSESVLHDQGVSSYIGGYDMMGEPVTFGATSGPSNGSLTLSSDGSFQYTPNAGFVGSDSFDFEASSINGADSGTVTINVYNSTPTAFDSSESVLHDQDLSSFVNGYDMDGDAVTFNIAGGPSQGTLCFGGDGSYIYTPNPGFVGSDSFNFEVSDGLATDTGTITINVYNSAPTAFDSSESVLHDQALSSWVNGYDMDGDAVTFSVAGGPSSGDLDFNADGSYTYTPNPGFVGSDSFDFEVTDDLASDTGTITINVYNSAPTAFDSSESVLHDQALSSWVNGYDMDGDAVTFSVSGGPSSGDLEFNADGSYTYTPDPGFVGTDSFDFEVTDDLASDTGTVTIYVYNTAPTAFDSSETIPHDTELSSWVNGYDMDGDAVTFSVEDGPSNGDLDFNDDGSYVYTPDFQFVGIDTFTFTVSDGIVASDPATVTITVYNTAPVAADDTFEYPDPGDEYVDIDVLGNDWDSEGDELSIQSVTSPSDGGTAEIITDPEGYQRIRFRPPASYNNSDPTIDVFSLGTEFQYTVADALGAIALAQVKAAAKAWTPWREYSRGNDDPNERIYETGKVKVELPIDAATSKINLKYTATATTSSMLRWVNPPGPPPWPELENVTGVVPAPAGATPEFQIYQPFLFLQPSAGAVGAVVPGAAAGVNLGYAGGVLSGEIEVGTFPAAAATRSGTAVIQMRVREVQIGGMWVPMFTDPAFMPPPGNPTRVVYGPVRQSIPWSVKFEVDAGTVKEKEASLDLTETPLPGLVPTPLRIINTSNKEGEVYKIGYPAHPGVLRKDHDPATPGAQDDPTTPGDQRADPATPIPDWDTKVKAKDK